MNNQFRVTHPGFGSPLTVPLGEGFFWIDDVLFFDLSAARREVAHELYLRDLQKLDLADRDALLAFLMDHGVVWTVLLDLSNVDDWAVGGLPKPVELEFDDEDRFGDDVYSEHYSVTLDEVRLGFGLIRDLTRIWHAHTTRDATGGKIAVRPEAFWSGYAVGPPNAAIPGLSQGEADSGTSAADPLAYATATRSVAHPGVPERVSVERAYLDVMRKWESSWTRPPRTDEEALAFLATMLNVGLKAYHPQILTTYAWNEEHLVWSPSGTRPRIVPFERAVGSDRSSLFHALCVQLAMHVDEGAVYRTCERCGTWFVRQQGRARHGQHRVAGVVKYCSDKHASGITSSTSRARKREVKRLRRQGFTIDEIVRYVPKIKRESVEKWCAEVR